MLDLMNSQLDRYQLRERLGSGGMARVYKAWDTSLERLVAIKILHEHLADDPTFKERFEREAKFIAGFNHPNIIQVYDYNVSSRSDSPLYYMVMSYVPGQTLREVLETAHVKGERLPRERVRELVADLAAALGYAHMRGMVHRDVKPGNILLNEHGRAILTDFGIARLVQSNRLTQDGVSTGTPIYMSPEQANGQAGDTRSDLYSLGIIVYEMLAGRPPFVDESSLSVMLKHLNTVPPLASEFIHTHQFDAFLAKALAKKPDERFQSAEEFARAFEAIFITPDFESTTMVPSIPQMNALPSTTGTTSVLRTVSMTLSQQVRTHPRRSGTIVFASVGVVALIILLLMNSNVLHRSQTLAPTTASTAETTAATADSSIYFASSFSSDDPTLRNWSTDSSSLLSRQFTSDGRYQMRSTMQQTASTSIYQSDSVYSNVSIDMIGRLEATSRPASAYGVVFRYQDENNYNVFAVDGEGRFGIWVRSQGVWTELRKKGNTWTPNKNINPLGQDNDLTVTIASNMISGFVNNTRVAYVTDSTLKDGRIGIYFATNDGDATVSVDSYQVVSSVPAMTG